MPGRPWFVGTPFLGKQVIVENAEEPLESRADFKEGRNDLLSVQRLQHPERKGKEGEGLGLGLFLQRRVGLRDAIPVLCNQLGKPPRVEENPIRLFFQRWLYEVLKRLCRIRRSAQEVVEAGMDGQR